MHKIRGHLSRLSDTVGSSTHTLNISGSQHCCHKCCCCKCKCLFTFKIVYLLSCFESKHSSSIIFCWSLTFLTFKFVTPRNGTVENQCKYKNLNGQCKNKVTKLNGKSESNQQERVKMRTLVSTRNAFKQNETTINIYTHDKSESW